MLLEDEEILMDKEEVCYHCGGPCEDEIIHAHDKEFCCEGCKLVFEVLNEADMCTYYDMEKSPGIRIKAASNEKFRFLDNKEIVQKLHEFEEGNTAKVKFYVPKIHCSSCIWLLENLNRLHDSVIHSQVNFLKKEVYLTYHTDELSLKELVELMHSIGYEPSITLDDFSKKKQQNKNKGFYYKLGIAGFTFGNIMLLSFPEYLDQNHYLDENYKQLFGYLNLVLALPAFLYSASDYYVSAYKALKNKFISIDLPISLGIFALFFRSAYEILSLDGAGFMDSFTMFVFLLLVGKWYQNRTYQALSFERDYKSYFPIAVTKILEGGREESVALKDLKVGDQIMLRNQEIIPADAELVKGNAKIDYSFVTGEADPTSKQVGELLFAGGKQVGASIRIRIKKPVSQSYLTRLWNQKVFAKGETFTESIVNKVSKYFTIFVLTVASVSLFYWWNAADGGTAIKVFTSVLIVACPCALALTLPFTFGNMMQVFGRMKCYLKNTQVIEKMASIDTLVFDKTGTLSYSQSLSVSYSGKGLSKLEQQYVKSLTANSTHPLSQALYNHLKESVLEAINYQEVTGKGIEGNVEGNYVKLGSAEFVMTEAQTKQENTSVVYIKINGEVKGCYKFKKAYREGLSKVIEKLKHVFTLHLLSGDNASEKEKLSSLFPSDNMRFKQSPADKLAYIEALQNKGKKVMMTGDGLNDAGALKQADVGIAITDDIYNFSPACDAILDADQFQEFPTYLGWSRKAMKIVRISFIISLCYNLFGLVFAVQGLLTPLFAAILMPISSITVVTFITIAVKWATRKPV